MYLQLMCAVIRREMQPRVRVPAWVHQRHSSGLRPWPVQHWSLEHVHPVSGWYIWCHQRPHVSVLQRQLQCGLPVRGRLHNTNPSGLPSRQLQHRGLRHLPAVPRGYLWFDISAVLLCMQRTLPCWVRVPCRKLKRHQPPLSPRHLQSGRRRGVHQLPLGAVLEDCNPLIGCMCVLHTTSLL